LPDPSYSWRSRVTPQAAEAQAPAATPRGTVTPAPPPADAAPPAEARASRRTGAVQIPANGGRIVLEVNKGTLVRLSGPAATVFVANPDIADVQVKSPTLVYISAKAPGETVIYAVDAADSVLLNAPILVQHDLSRLRSSLRQLAPGEGVAAESVDGNLVLSGVVSDAGKADKVRALATSIASEVKGAQVINRMTVATPNQVNLRVGVNWSKIGSNLAFQTFNPTTIAGELTNPLRVGQLTEQAPLP
jgi:Flp pilus assembly secretin CpaC